MLDGATVTAVADGSQFCEFCGRTIKEGEHYRFSAVDRAADRLDFGVECDRWIRRTITAERLGEREIRRMYAAAIRSKLQQENPPKP